MIELFHAPKREQHLLYALGLMCNQYLGEIIDGQEVLDHQCMGAGEEAYKALEAYGLVEVSGRGATWTPKAEALFDMRLNQQTFPK